MNEKSNNEMQNLQSFEDENHNQLENLAINARCTNEQYFKGRDHVIIRRFLRKFAKIFIEYQCNKISES